MRTMYKPFLLTVFALLISLQNPQVSFSQGGEADICSGDCMIVWSDEYAPDISDVYFDKDQFALDETAKDILKKNTEFLKNNPNIRLELQGHCDEIGSNNENIILGKKRADLVKKYLISLGINPDRMNVISYGEEKPFCMLSNEACWKLNNRVHFRFPK